jgi:hypothetical protein
MPWRTTARFDVATARRVAFDHRRHGDGMPAPAAQVLRLR